MGKTDLPLKRIERKKLFKRESANKALENNSKSNNTDNLPDISKILLNNDKICNISEEKKFNVV